MTDSRRALTSSSKALAWVDIWYEGLDDGSRIIGEVTPAVGLRIPGGAGGIDSPGGENGRPGGANGTAGLADNTG